MSNQKPRLHQIQALRALAAGLVLVYHARWVPGGYIGVDIFYVISGFLITGLLIRELEESTTIHLLGFYARRFKRLLPSSFLVIVCTGLAGWFLLPASMRQVFGQDLIAAATYISNILFAFWNNDYQNLNVTPSPFIHFWSLAVEEQFYLFWPLLILSLYKWRSRQGVFIGISVVGISSFVYSLFLTDKSPIWSFYILPTRAWELSVGALLIFLPDKLKRPPQIALASIVAIVFGSFYFNDQTAFPGLAALLPVLATAALIANVANWPPFLEKLSALRITQWIGAISYPLYLWHWPILVMPVLYRGRELETFEVIFLLLLTLLIADLTHRFVEEPIRYLNLSTRQSFKIAGITTFASIALGAGIYISYSNTITIAGVGSYTLEEIRSKPKNDADGCHIHVGKTISPKCEYGDISSTKTLVLYGDSHAAQWLPALDLIGKKRGLKIVSLTKSACPSPEVIKEISSQYKIEDCQAFRDNSISRIAKIRPVAVIVTGMQPAKLPYSDKDGQAWWLAGAAKTLTRIEPFTQFPIYLSDTPLPHRDIPNCLIQGLGQACDKSTPIDSTVAKGFIKIDPTPWLCRQECAAIIDGIITYRDQSHLSVAMSEHLAPQLESELLRIGIFESE